ncbi:UDP-N-acetylmuramate--L-alanine ligase [compost metagenome]
MHQPHRYSRLASLFEDFSACFNDADTVLIAPVYAAGEEAIDGVNAEELVNRIKAGGHRDARYVVGPETIAPVVSKIAQPGDFVVLLGAGSITYWAAALPRELADISGN